MANHFEGHGEISKKNELLKNMKGLFESNNENVFQVLPLTYYVKVNLETPLQSIKQQLAPFRAAYKLLKEFSSPFKDEFEDSGPVKMTVNLEDEDEEEEDENEEDSEENKQQEVLEEKRTPKKKEF